MAARQGGEPGAGGGRRAGFSLFGLLVFLAVVAILAGALVPAYFRQLMEARENATRAELEDLAGAVAAFCRDTGRVPTEGEGLAALVADPGVAGWQGPYLSTLDEEPVRAATTDAWGQPYVFDAAPTLDTAEVVAALVASGGRDRAIASGAVDSTWSTVAPGDDLLQPVRLADLERELDLATSAGIEAIAAAAQMQFRTTGRYPADLAELDDAYLDAGPGGAALADGWRRAYVLLPDSLAVPPVLRVRSLGPNGVDDGGAGDDLQREYSSAAPGRRNTLYELGIAQAALDAAPGLALTGVWSTDRAALGLGAFLQDDGWGNDYELQCSTRTVLSAGPDAVYVTGGDNLPRGVTPDDCVLAAGELEYVGGSAVPTGAQCDDVSFQLFNGGSTPATISSMAVTWAKSNVWCEQIAIDGTVVFFKTAPKLASGETAVFTAPYAVPAGASVTVVIGQFRKNANSGGQRQDMSGVDFTIELDDGTVITFTAGSC